MAYKDCYDAMERALESSKGIRMRFPDEGKATYYRMRCHNARAIRRAENAKTYERGHPMHGTSIFDILVLQIRYDAEGNSWIYFIKNEFKPELVEDLSELDDEPITVPYTEVRQIEGPKDELAPELTEVVKSVMKRRV